MACRPSRAPGSIGGNHLIHLLRRNFDLNVLLFNNQIYGLTKGQYSPTSETGKRTKTSPMGSLDYPFNPVSLALGAEATFVARTIDMDREHTAQILQAAYEHHGTAFIEIYQNCNVFNDKAFQILTGRQERDANRIYLEAGQPIVSAAAGKVVYAGSGLSGYGRLIIIKHNNDFLSAYAHNRKLIAREGQWVNKGEVIAQMGSSGTDRTQLHFEIRKHGRPVDPLRYLPSR